MMFDVILPVCVVATSVETYSDAHTVSLQLTTRELPSAPNKTYMTHVNLNRLKMLRNNRLGCFTSQKTIRMTAGNAAKIDSRCNENGVAIISVGSKLFYTPERTIGRLKEVRVCEGCRVRPDRSSVLDLLPTPCFHSCKRTISSSSSLSGSTIMIDIQP